MVKKINGMIAVKASSKKYHLALYNCDIFTKTKPKILPTVIPHRSQIILLYVLNKLLLSSITPF
jgi:hypothetical protein